MHQGDLGGKHAVAADETLGPIDGIDQPEVVRVGLLFAALLAVEAVIGECSQQYVLDDFLGPPIRYGYGRLVLFQLDREVSAIIVEDVFGGRFGGRSGGLEAGFQHHRNPILQRGER